MSTQDQVVFFLRDREMDNDRYGYKDREMIELDGDRVIKIEIYKVRGRDIELFIDQAR